MHKIEILKSITDRLLDILHELYGYYLDSTNGFRLYKWEMQQEAKAGVPGKFFSNSRPDDPNALILHDAQIKDLILRNEHEGSNVNKTRQYIITMILEHWEHDFRPKIASTLGLKKKEDLKSDIMGDINKIRHDILHNRGIAKNSSNNKLIKFKKNESIIVSESAFKQIFAEIFNYLNNLFIKETGAPAYIDNSLNQKSKTIHRAIKPRVLEVQQNYTPELNSKVQ